MKDLGLTYEAAGHGIQSALRYDMTQRGIPDDEQDATLKYIKHLRVGVDMRASDAFGLVELLISKGVITLEEYIEHMRLAANHELARYERHMRDQYGLPEEFDFR